jgi:signal transduction histidine kinase
MDENLSIFKKGLLLIGIPLLAQVLFLGVLAKIRSDQADAQRWAIHTKDVMARAEGAYRLAVEANSDLRAYAVSGDVDFDKAFDRDHERIASALLELRGLIQDNPTQQARLDVVRQKAEQLVSWLDEVSSLLAANKREQALQRIDDLEGKDRVDAMRSSLDKFLEEEHNLDLARQAGLARAMREQNWALAGGCALAVASAGALLFVFTRSIGRRLERLSENARRLGAGKELAAPLTGRDEIGRLDRVFHDMADALAQKERENEMFVYSVSHDLRAPLVNLQGFSQELATVCGELRTLVEEGGLPEDSRRRALQILDRDAGQSIHFIQSAVKRLSGIIDALLRLSRVGRVEYRMQVVDVRAAVVRVVESLRDTISRHGAEVTLGELPPARGDPVALEQVFANLIGNAVNYLDPKRPGRIEVGCRANTGALAAGLRLYYVKDNGLGIPETQQAKLFHAFQRLHPQVAPGEGIGLALVRRVVERHGGKVWLESTAGVGSTFLVALPADQPPGSPPPPDTERMALGTVPARSL